MSFHKAIDHAEELDGEGIHDGIRAIVDVYETSDDPDEIREALGAALSELVSRLT